MVTLTNTSGATITGPFSLVVDGLSSNATLVNKTGDLSLGPPFNPYVTANAGLAPGESASVALQFTNPTKAAITYNTRILAGPGAR